MKYILLLLLFPLALQAQTEAVLEDSLQAPEAHADSAYLQQGIVQEEYKRAPYEAPPLAPITLREVPADKWDKASGVIDYSKDIPKIPKARKKRENSNPGASFDWTNMTQGLGSFLQVMAVIFALGVIAYGIFRMMQAPRNRAISRDGTEITLANLDEFIHETDLERFLREALARSNWPLAVRLYFLQTIKRLTEKEAIVWSKEKTNRDYLREMRGHRLAAHFKDVVQQYERVWYGNLPLSSAEFARLEPEFKALLGEI